MITWDLANHPEVRKVDAEAGVKEYGSAHPMGARMMSVDIQILHEQLRAGIGSICK